jgi:hypothetical protein
LAFQEFLFDVRISGGGQEGRQPVLASYDVVDDGAGLDDAGLPHERRHAEAALEGGTLLAPEGVIAAVGAN